MNLAEKTVTTTIIAITATIAFPSLIAFAQSQRVSADAHKLDILLLDAQVTAKKNMVKYLYAMNDCTTDSECWLWTQRVDRRVRDYGLNHLLSELPDPQLRTILLKQYVQHEDFSYSLRTDMMERQILWDLYVSPDGELADMNDWLSVPSLALVDVNTDMTVTGNYTSDPFARIPSPKEAKKPKAPTIRFPKGSICVNQHSQLAIKSSSGWRLFNLGHYPEGTKFSFTVVEACK
ncbi:MAG TPA: hypothetical protein VK184_25640 [Nostocaceae cyanobacterium]|nr:hypothetical protein [Nostocaceae cyanobacterium]